MSIWQDEAKLYRPTRVEPLDGTLHMRNRVLIDCGRRGVEPATITLTPSLYELVLLLCLQRKLDSPCGGWIDIAGIYGETAKMNVHRLRERVKCWTLVKGHFWRVVDYSKLGGRLDAERSAVYIAREILSQIAEYQDTRIASMARKLKGGT